MFLLLSLHCASWFFHSFYCSLWTFFFFVAIRNIILFCRENSAHWETTIFFRGSKFFFCIMTRMPWMRGWKAVRRVKIYWKSWNQLERGRVKCECDLQKIKFLIRKSYLQSSNAFYTLKLSFSAHWTLIISGRIAQTIPFSLGFSSFNLIFMSLIRIDFFIRQARVDFTVQTNCGCFYRGKKCGKSGDVVA